MTINKNKLTLSQLEQYLSKAAWILKGPVDASDFKVYIFPPFCRKSMSRFKRSMGKKCAGRRPV